MQSHARVVIVGGGVVGANILYQLAKRGWTDTALVERTQLTAGSTWHAAGLIPLYGFSLNRSRLIRKSLDIYRTLEAETGQAVGWHNCGQLRIANSPQRMDEYLAHASVAGAQGIEAAILSPAEVRRLWPLLEGSPHMVGGLYHPEDGHIAPADVTQAAAQGARARGARIYLQTRVTGFERLASGEWRVQTDRGDIVCEHVVTATGLYARDTAALVGLRLPAIPVVHQYWVTEAVPEINERRRAGLPEMPVLRDETINGYVREEGDGLMFGPYETAEHVQLFAERGVPEWFGSDLLPENFASVEENWTRAIEFIPALGRAGIKSNVRGPFQMTPDHMPLVGPSGLVNFWLAEGLPGGITWGGGVGHYLASWIIDGDPGIDMSDADPRRFPAAISRRWTCAKVRGQMGFTFGIHDPEHEWPFGRPAKTVPSHDLLSNHGAAWGCVNEWEVPNWFVPEGAAAGGSGFRHAAHEALVRAEARSMREGAGLAEMSAATKFEVSGPAAEPWLNAIMAADMPHQVGGIRLVHLLTATGTLRAQFRVARLAADRFYLVGNPEAEPFDWRALAELLPAHGGATLRNVTIEHGCVAVVGPRAREVLQPLTDLDLSNLQFPWQTAKTGEIALAPDVLFLRSNRQGELGWELHHPICYNRHLVQTLLQAGREFGLRLVGRRALDSLRIEKSYREIGRELTTDRTALESGLDAFIDWQKPAFIGRDALLRQRRDGLRHRLVTLEIELGDGGVQRYASVFRDDRLAGFVTSSAPAHWLGVELAMAFVAADDAQIGAEYAIPVLGRHRRAKVVADSPYDPRDERPRL